MGKPVNRTRMTILPQETSEVDISQGSGLTTAQEVLGVRIVLGFGHLDRGVQPSRFVSTARTLA
jgi:hypothetical protein